MKNANSEMNFNISRRRFLSSGITVFAVSAIGYSLYDRLLENNKNFAQCEFNANGWYISTQEAKVMTCMEVSHAN